MHGIFKLRRIRVPGKRPANRAAMTLHQAYIKAVEEFEAHCKELACDEEGIVSREKVLLYRRLANKAKNIISDPEVLELLRTVFCDTKTTEPGMHMRLALEWLAFMDAKVCSILLHSCDVDAPAHQIFNSPDGSASSCLCC